MNSPLISIIVPCYNVEKYLPKCINSIIRQTYNNLEIWLVDDGSPDRCGQICDEYAAIDNRIRVIHKTNGGLSDARNVAIDKAVGEWITFVDSDDYVTDDYIETLYYIATKYGCEASVACFQMVHEGEKTPSRKEQYFEEQLESSYAVEQMFYQEKFDNSAWGKLYHRSLFETGIRYPKGLVYEDLATTYKLLFKCKYVAFTNKVIYYYLIRESSIEGEYNPQKIDSVMQVIQRMNNDIGLLQPVAKAFKCRIFSFLLHILLPMPPNVPYYQEMKGFITKNRCAVLLDKRARKKARVAALLSFFGIDFLKFVFSLVNRRK